MVPNPEIEDLLRKTLVSMAKSELGWGRGHEGVGQRHDDAVLLSTGSNYEVMDHRQ